MQKAALLFCGAEGYTGDTYSKDCNAKLEIRQVVAATEEHIGMMDKKPFLELILGIKISRIEYPKAQEAIGISANAKSVRLDIYVEDGKETVYNIEMQTTENRNLLKRTRYYQGMIDFGYLGERR